MKNVIKVICAFSSILLLFSVFYSPTISKASELDDLNAQIQAKQKEQQATLKKIKDIDSNIRNLSKNTSNSNDLLGRLKTQKLDLTKQVELLDEQITQQDKNLAEFEIKLNEKEESIKQKINYLYKLSFSQPNFIFSTSDDINDYFSERAEVNVSIDLYKSEIKDFYKKIELANEAKEQSKKDKEIASATVSELEKQISETSQKIAANNAAIAAENRNKSSLVAKSNELANQLQFLSAKQQELLNAELAKMNSSGQTNQKPLQPGQYYFMGRGRDLIEGHGLGMSQWGAFGMAQKGWDFNQILTFYYTGVTIGDYVEPTEIRVPDKANAYPPAAKARGYLTIDEYLAGIGEVPNYWPAEAVKAQVVAARTYVMAVCKNQASCQICGTASCQVYNGVTPADPTGMGKLPFVNSTKGKVILYNGNPITAFYSASHRGCSSTLNTVWGSSDRPYIKSVNDDPYAFKEYKSPNPYNPSQSITTYNWTWRTNGYTLEDLKSIFSRSNALNVGNVQNINIQNDNCGRVARITLVGSSGTKTLTGWDFRAIFNANTPFNDYIYSTEFGFYQNL